MTKPVDWRCATGEPCEGEGDVPVTAVVVGVIDGTTSVKDRLDPLLVDVTLTSRFDNSVIPVKRKNKDPNGGVDFRFEQVKTGWYEVRATRKLSATGPITREATRVVRIVKIAEPKKPSDQEQALTLLLKEPPEGLQEYVAALNEALKALKNVNFQRADIQLSGFEHRESKHDEANWRVLDDNERGFVKKLGLAPGILPHVAVEEIIARPEQWTFDCGQFTQVAQMFARRRSIGAAAFDGEAGALELREEFSRGRGNFILFTAPIMTNGALPTTLFDNATGQEVTIDDVLAQAPIGSRVGWSKPNEPEGGVFFSENTLKIGDDTYHAHGLDGNPFTRAAFEKRYRRVGTPGPVVVTLVEYVRHTRR